MGGNLNFSSATINWYMSTSYLCPPQENKAERLNTDHFSPEIWFRAFLGL